MAKRKPRHPDMKLLKPVSDYDVGRFSEGHWSPLIENGTGVWYVGHKVKRTTVLSVDDAGSIERFRTYKRAYYRAAHRDADDWLHAREIG